MQNNSKKSKERKSKYPDEGKRQAEGKKCHLPEHLKELLNSISKKAGG